MRVWATLTAMTASLLALPLLHPLFVNPRWLTGPAILIVVIGLIGALARALTRRRIPAVAIVGLQLLSVVLVLTTRHAGDTALLGIVPTPSSLRALAELAGEGRLDLYTSTAPVALTPGIELVVLALIALFALTIDVLTVVARMPSLSGLLLLILLLVPLSLHYTGVGPLTFAAAGLGFVLLLAVDGWMRIRAGEATETHTATTTRIAVLAVLAALLTPLAIPGLSNDAVFELVEPPQGQADSVTTADPLVSLRRDLLSPSDEEVLHYITSAEQPAYLRTAALEEFDGTHWTMASVQATRDQQLDDPELPASPGPWDITDPTHTEVSVSAQAGGMSFLPLPYPADELHVSGDWYLDSATDTVFSPTEEAGGLTYTTTTPQPDFTRTDLAEAPESLATIDERHLDLPADLSPEITELTEEVVAGNSGPHERAVALQDWFTGGEFSYDLRPPEIPSGVDPLTFFLTESQTGYCEQFAAAMAVMARIADIPARVAVGYTGGQRAGGAERWVVTEQHAHAWPELYFPGYGWLRFEPTPSTATGQGSATVPDYAQTTAEEDGETDEDTSTGPETGVDDQAADLPGELPPDEQFPDGQPVDGPTTADPAADHDALPAVWLVVTVVVLALLAAGTAPALFRVLVRYVRWYRADTAEARAHAAWRELQDDCVDLGIRWNSAESPRALARRLPAECPLTVAGQAALDRITDAEERARYAPTPAVQPDLSADSRTVGAALYGRVSRGRRIRALLLPWSLVGGRSRSRARGEGPAPATSYSPS